jgi:hypothetical protein
MKLNMENYKTNPITKYFGLAGIVDSVKMRMKSYETNPIIRYSVLLAGLYGPYREKWHYQYKNEQLKRDLVAIANGGNVHKDLCFYLRPLKLAGTIRFQNMFNKSIGLINFEEALSRTLDKPGRRYAFCVGDGDERWGLAKLVLENELWKKDVVPLFKNVSAIISMPGATDGCLNESYLIRNTIELCKRTIFVIPPLNCYNPPRWKEKLDIRDYYNQVIRRHAQEVGLHFPDAQMNAGVFLLMDPHTGQPANRLEWQEYNFINTNLDYYGGVKSQTVHTSQTLDATRIKEAVAMIA